MMRKKPLSRYRLGEISDRELLRGAWLATPRDFKSTIRGKKHVMHQQGLVPLEDLPREELLARYVRSARKSLQSSAKAGDLDLYEANPDRPDDSILFADEEVLFRTRRQWEAAAYSHPGNFSGDESLKARYYAQVVAAFYPTESAHFIVEKLRDPATYADWQKLEKSGAVVRDEYGDVTIRR